MKVSVGCCSRSGISRLSSELRESRAELGYNQESFQGPAIRAGKRKFFLISRLKDRGAFTGLVCPVHEVCGNLDQNNIKCHGAELSAFPMYGCLGSKVRIHNCHGISQQKNKNKN
jgi:hypothetical protein